MSAVPRRLSTPKPYPLLGARWGHALSLVAMQIAMYSPAPCSHYFPLYCFHPLISFVKWSSLRTLSCKQDPCQKRLVPQNKPTDLYQKGGYLAVSWCSEVITVVENEENGIFEKYPPFSAMQMKAEHKRLSQTGKPFQLSFVLRKLADWR